MKRFRRSLLHLFYFWARFWPISFPNLLWLLFFGSLLSFIGSFVLVYKYFLLSIRYLNVIGRFLIGFLEQNASKETLTTTGLKKSSLSKKKLK